MSQAIQAIPLLGAQLADYRRRWPSEAPTVQAFEDLLHDSEDPFLRERLSGHFTASAWLVSADGVRALLTHHRKLERWLQPGGHADGDRDTAHVALKEAREESGLHGLQVQADSIFDLDRHWIPAWREVPGHWHYDLRYVVHAGSDECFVVSEESIALAWRPIHQLALDPDPSISRMASKWLAKA
ncbi:MAG: NUDIX hydrolase [Pseudoxanthomonas sp.]|nr:NUDIX hydrolase [Pseudoxanthomonas sp.]